MTSGIILLFALLIPLSILGVIVYMAVRWPLGFALFCATATLLAVSGWMILERRHRLAHVPDALQIEKIVYANEESWGFGPGGNEAGIIVYALPHDVAERIEAHGLRYLANLPANPEGRFGTYWQGKYDHWKETPIIPGDHWRPAPDSGRSPIDDYLCAYGFCIDIDDRIVGDVDRMLRTPGSYYAFGRIGLIVVCPARRRVVYMYNG